MNQTMILRTSRIRKLKATIVEAGQQDKVMSYEKLVSLLMHDYYLTRRTAREYLDSVIDGTRIKRVKDEIFYIPGPEIADILKSPPVDKSQ